MGEEGLIVDSFCSGKNSYILESIIGEELLVKNFYVGNFKYS